MGGHNLGIESMGRRQKFAGGFQQYVERINAHAACPQGVLGACLPRKMLDFMPFEIVSNAFSEYRPQTAHLALKAYTLASVAL